MKVHWESSAQWTLETSDSQAVGSWAPVPIIPEREEFSYTVEIPNAKKSGYFRLRRDEINLLEEMGVLD